MKKLNFTICPTEYNEQYPHPVFFKTEGDIIYVDMIKYMNLFEHEDRIIGIDDFKHKFSFQLDCLAKSLGIETGDLFAVDSVSGNTMLVDKAELLLFEYMDLSFGPYMLARMKDLFDTGFTVSDMALEMMINNRFNKKDL